MRGEIAQVVGERQAGFAGEANGVDHADQKGLDRRNVDDLPTLDDADAAARLRRLKLNDGERRHERLLRGETVR
jgi:hypothetical protein